MSKYDKIFENIRKYEKIWGSMRQYETVWESMKKYEKCEKVFGEYLQFNMELMTKKWSR